MATKLYPSHIPTSAIQKAVLSLGSALTAITDPKRGDMVATMGETTAIGPVLRNIHKRMLKDRVGKLLLERKPRITDATIDRERLKRLPDGTFGREYARFLDDLHTHPDARPPVQYIDDPELVYVMQRFDSSV